MSTDTKAAPRRRGLTRGGWRLLVVFAVFVAAAVTPVAVVMRLTAKCEAKVAADAALVHTEHNWTDADVDGVGWYEDVHWQRRPIGEACRPLRRSTTYEYTAVVKLRPPDAARLEKRCSWQPVTPVTASGLPDNAAIPEALAGYVPEDARWSTCDRYRATALGRYAGTVYFDTVDALLYAQFREASGADG